MKEQYKLLFAYEKWATGRVLETLKQLPALDEQCLEWMAHILLAQLMWYSRLVGVPINYIAWDKKTLEDCEKMHDDLPKVWKNYLTGLDEESLLKTIKYSNTKGESFENPIKDILTHVINHSTYHRGQIIARLKGQLPSLPSTDYILFIREKQN